MRPARPLVLLSAVALVVIAAGCGAGAEAEGSSGARRPTVVVTTSLLGDVVTRIVGDAAAVTVLMPRGADPHQVQLSARQAAELREADALITNGAGFEEGMVDALDAAEADGVPTHEAISDVAPLTDADGDIDPHFFTDPDRMAAAAEGIGDFLTEEVPALDAEAFRSRVAAEVASLADLAAEVDDSLAVIPRADRRLVTNHEVFDYFADRFDFEVVGTVIPGAGTAAEPSARDLAALAATIEVEDVPAIFADVSSPEALSDALAEEVGAVEVVALFTESLGGAGSGAETYDALVRTDASRIVAALT